LHCGIEETGSLEIIVILYHQVLCNPSELGTGAMKKHLPAKVHIPKLKKITELDLPELTSLTVD
jgi:hypothetical protein